MNSNQLLENEYAGYFSTYINRVENNNLQEELEICLHEFIKFVQNIPLDKFDFRYAEGKWTIKEIIQHIIDTERIFAYRALRISRNDQTPLPGFDENEYADGAKFSEISFESLLNQYRLVREGSLALFESFSEEVCSQIGSANGNAVSARALVWMIAGHEIHHLKVLQDKYNVG